MRLRLETGSGMWVVLFLLLKMGDERNALPKLFKIGKMVDDMLEDMAPVETTQRN